MSKKKSSNFKRWLVIPDLHVPNHDPKSLALVNDWIDSERWDGILQLGDFMDFPSLHSASRTNLRRQEESQTFAEDYENGKAILEGWRQSHKGRIVILEGNHDYRIERLIDEFPRLGGSLEVREGLDLDKYKADFVRSWSNSDYFQLGKARFVHGFYTSKNHTTQTGLNFGLGDNIFYGHCHDVECKSFKKPKEKDTWVAQSLGHLADEKLIARQYTRGRPLAWQQAVTEFRVFPDGTFHYFICRIIKGRLVRP